MHSARLFYTHFHNNSISTHTYHVQEMYTHVMLANQCVYTRLTYYVYATQSSPCVHKLDTKSSQRIITRQYNLQAIWNTYILRQESNATQTNTITTDQHMTHSNTITTDQRTHTNTITTYQTHLLLPNHCVGV